MGYRSDVTIAIYGSEHVIAPLLAAQRMLSDSAIVADKDYVKSYGFSAPLGYGSEFVKQHMILAEFENVKWYESYPDVHRWENLVSEASQNPEICTEFVRIGEESGDIETRYSGDDCAHYIEVFSTINTDEIPSDTTYSEDQNDNSITNAS